MVLDPVRYHFEADDTDGAWRLRHFHLTERLSSLYRCSVDLSHPLQGADLESLLGSSCAITLSRGDAVERRVCGIIHRVRRLGGRADSELVRADVAPALWALGQSMGARIFQQMTVPAILEEVLTDGLSPYQRRVRLDLRRNDYAERDYCVQYHETDLAFVQRLLQEEGIGFYFDHDGDVEELVLVDVNERFPACETFQGGSLPLIGRDTGAPDIEVVHTFDSAQALTSTGVLLHEFDWLRPAMPVHHEARGRDARERERLLYDCEPALCLGAQSNDGAARKQIRREEATMEAATATGEGNAIGFLPGRSFELEGHGIPELDGTYILLEVTHEGTAPDELARDDESGAEYSNRFQCFPSAVPFRPQRVEKRPFAGTQTALVVGPAGEEVYTDEHGRIKVQFHWDPDGERNERSSCWIRVAQPWAGAGFGAVFLPRIGMEVVVQFLEGNADRPLVVGTVYNGTNPSPFPLPQEKTKTTITTRSSPGGSGYNELSFEDAAGQEEISLHAQKDLTVKVLNDHSSSIGHDESITVANNQQIQVGNDRSWSVGNNESHTVGSNRTTSIGANEQVSVGGNRTESVSGEEQVTIGASRTHTIAANEQVTVGASRTLTVGASDTVSVAAAHTRNIGASEQVTVGSGQTIQVGGIKNESVGGLSLENVGGAKTLSIGGAYAVTVGAAMNTSVGGASLEEVGLIKIVKVGRKLELSCGSSKLILEKSGKVTISGKSFEFVASGKVTINGSTIDLN